MRQKNIVYFSGVHGTGKSTLIETLLERAPELYIEYQKMKIPKRDDESERAKVRIARFYLQGFYQEKLAEENPEKIILCDRSLLDDYAYTNGFLRLGWLTEKEVEDLNTAREIMFYPDRKPDNVVLLFPSLEETIANIKRRWKTEPIKWREDNFEYLAAVRQEHQKFFEKYPGNVLKIETMDLDERARLSHKWMQELATPKAQRLAG